MPGLTVIAVNTAVHPGRDKVFQAINVLRERSCGMLFTVNEWGIDREGILHDYLETEKIVHVNWCVDDPFYEEIMLEKKFIPSPLRIDFVSDRDYLRPMHAAGYNPHFLPLGVDSSIFYPSTKAHEHPCSFVGNSYLGQIKKFSKGAEGVLDTVLPFLAACLKRYLGNAAIDLGGEIAEFVAKIDLPEGFSADRAAFVTKHFAGYLFRKQMIGMLAASVPGFALYGDDGWRELLENVDVKKVRYGRKLADVYESTTVNVDINRVVIRNGFTQRIFDTLATGAFVVTSAKPIVDEFFVTTGEKKEVVTFGSGEELVDNVRYYLSHESERTAVARRGRECVLGGHTYDHRMGELFRVVSREIGRVP